jgi:stalled ribosome rescue protein Dom34
MVLRGIFEPKRDEVTGEWRKLHIEELNDLYFLNKYYSGDQIKKNKLGERRDAYSVLVGKPKGKRPLGRPRRRWEHNIKMNL